MHSTLKYAVVSKLRTLRQSVCTDLLYSVVVKLVVDSGINAVITLDFVAHSIIYLIRVVVASLLYTK